MHWVVKGAETSEATSVLELAGNLVTLNIVM
jgi:hypothetical protein